MEKEIFFLKICCDESVVSELCQMWEKDATTKNKLFVLNGDKVHNQEQFYNEVVNVFKFPLYFGRNLNALYDSLTDEHYLDGDKFLILIKLANKFLDCDITLRNAIIDTLNDVGLEWSQPVNDGEVWDRNAKNFRVLFHFLSKNDEPVGFTTYPVINLSCSVSCPDTVRTSYSSN